MPRTRKYLLPRNLNKYDVYIEEFAQFSNYFRIANLPPVFTGGRNSFLVGGSELLVDKSEILIEILDVTGKPVYQTPVKNYLESKSKLISVEIYDDTPVGFGYIIIMGKAKQSSTGAPIPEPWQDKYNIRWVGKILIDGGLPNTSPIRFKNTPTALVTENLLRTVVTASYQTRTSLITASLSPTLFSSIHSGYSISASAPTSFSSEHYNGVLTGSVTINGNMSAITLPISNILNSSTAFSDGNLLTVGGSQIRSMELRSGSYQTLVDGALKSVTSSAQMEYYVLSSPSTGVKTSYANLRVVNLDTVSGELYKIRVYSKPSTDFADFKLIGDVLVNTSELLVSASNRGAVDIGNFANDFTPSDVWYADTLALNTGIQSSIYPISGSAAYYTPPVSPTYTLSVNDSILLRSVMAGVPLNGTKFAGIASSSGYFIGTRNDVQLFPTTEYTLQFDAYFKQTSASVNLEGNTPKLDIYLVGDVIDDNPLGQKIGSFTPGSNLKWYQQAQVNFSPAVSEGKFLGLRFVVSNGFWNFSNISLKPASETRFSPDEISIIVPNTEYRNKVLQYKVEFFDINNNSANINAMATPLFFTGSAIDLGTLL